MSKSNYNLGLGPNGLGAQFRSPAIEKIVLQEERMQKMFSSPFEDSIRKREAMLGGIISPPALGEMQAQQSILSEQLALSNAVSADMQAPVWETLSLQPLVTAMNQPLQDLPMYSLAEKMGQALGSLNFDHEKIVNSLCRGLEACIPTFEFMGETVFRLASCIDHDAITRAFNAIEDIRESALKGLFAFNNVFSNIDVSGLFNISSQFTYIADFEEKNELLKSFGWFLISELPDEIIDEIYERRDEITQEEVDSLIVQHFRNNSCQELKLIVSSWKALPYFESRKIVFHEAQVCHSRRSFNASTALISLHFEGVVTDFVRDRIMAPTYHKWAEKALKCVNDLTNDLTMGAMPYKDWIVCASVLECVDQAFTTNFSPADPDSCPNISRHKIAHGHATAKETEANSLRRFLFMNELYKLFCCLENAYQLAS